MTDTHVGPCTGRPCLACERWDELITHEVHPCTRRACPGCEGCVLPIGSDLESPQAGSEGQ